MGKTLDYPKASFKSAQDMAIAVDSLGGSCSVEICAEKMGNKISGGFHNIISSAQKFRLVTYKAGQLTLTQLYKDIKLSYTEEEKRHLLISSFLSPPVFSRLYERFKGEVLPVSLLDKMLIKEYQVDDAVASRLKKYFIDGAKLTGLLNAQNQVLKIDGNINSSKGDEDNDEVAVIEPQQSVISENIPLMTIIDSDEFTFHIVGPGINTRVAIREEEDFMILEAVIKKVKKRFNASLIE